MIECFCFFRDESLIPVLNKLAQENIVSFICSPHTEVESRKHISTAFDEFPFSSANFQKAAQLSRLEYSLFFLTPQMAEEFTIDIYRWLVFALNSQAVLSYSDHYVFDGRKLKNKPLTHYQGGSIRDNFDFGGLVLIPSRYLKVQSQTLNPDLKHAGWYNLRLELSKTGSFLHIPEPLYTTVAADDRKSGEKVFDYVNPDFIQQQKEMESVATNYLKSVGAKVSPPFENCIFTSEFQREASIIIPVKNREKTIADAVKSALNQDFQNFNIIVINNYSTDGTGKILDELKKKHSNLIHYIPDKKDLEIGGCWNEGLRHPECGKFAVQLDSDDLYKDDQSLRKIIDCFYRENCAMVIGSYELTDFNLKPLPPGLIDHNEWTPENGPNNALRINGLGAPRAFYTPIARKTGFPNVSYGEDYSMALRISSQFKTGRIYESLYLCRRWEDNSDASLSFENENKNNIYKDFVRTQEIAHRKNANRRSNFSTFKYRS